MLTICWTPCLVLAMVHPPLQAYGTRDRRGLPERSSGASTQWVRSLRWSPYSLASQESGWGNPAMCPASALTPCTQGAHPPTDSTVGSLPLPMPTKHTVLSGCAASVTHRERLPLHSAWSFHGPAKLSSDALCSVQLPRSPTCTATLLPRVLCLPRSRGLSPVSQAQSRLPTVSIANAWPTAGAQKILWMSLRVSGFVGQGPQTTPSRMDPQCVTAPFLVERESCTESSGPGASWPAFESAVLLPPLFNFSSRGLFGSLKNWAEDRVPRYPLPLLMHSLPCYQRPPPEWDVCYTWWPALTRQDHPESSLPFRSLSVVYTVWV